MPKISNFSYLLRQHKKEGRRQREEEEEGEKERKKEGKKEGRKERRKEGKKEGRKERKKEGKKEGRKERKKERRREGRKEKEKRKREKKRENKEEREKKRNWKVRHHVFLSLAYQALFLSQSIALSLSLSVCFHVFCTVSKKRVKVKGCDFCMKSAKKVGGYNKRTRFSRIKFVD